MPFSTIAGEVRSCNPRDNLGVLAKHASSEKKWQWGGHVLVKRVWHKDQKPSKRIYRYLTFGSTSWG